VCRHNPAAGNLRPGSGEMTEEFDKKLQNPPEGVQVLTSCVAKQQSLEFDSGGVFLQALNAALITMDARLNNDGPDKALPMELLTERINLHLTTLLKPHKLTQTARLSGKEPANGAGPNPNEEMPPQLVIVSPPIPGGRADPALVQLMLNEINELPPVRGSRAKNDMLKPANFPAFPANVLDPYQADATSPELKKAVLDAVQALKDSARVPIDEKFVGANNAAVKKLVFGKQGAPGRAVLVLEEALDELKKAGEDFMDKEKSKRWKANYEYTLARLESRLVFLMEYNYVLAQIRSDSLPPLEGGFAGYVLGSKEKVTIPEGKVKDWVKEVRRTWDKLAKDHPNTPYAILAQRERMTVLGLEWRPTR